MKLELKHLAPYLPYGVEVYQPNAEGKKTFTLDVEGLRIMEVQGFENFKLKLRPLSKLSEKELIPIGLIIGEILKREATYKDNLFAKEDASAWLKSGMRPVLSLVQVKGIMEYLCYIHADFDGLIEKGLAVELTEKTQ